jgi:hypothetical protein
MPLPSVARSHNPVAANLPLSIIIFLAGKIPDMIWIVELTFGGGDCQNYFLSDGFVPG